MTVVSIIDEITKWATEEICSKVKFKAPPERDEESNSSKYDYKLVTPACFSLFIPSKDKLPPSYLTPIPAMCVSVVEGNDNLTTNIGVLTIQFSFATWHTGTHGKDYFIPVGDGSFKQCTDDEYFKRDADGWRDVWNWIDIALRAIESSQSINGIEIDRASGVKFYPFKEQEAIVDYYPYWFAGIQFKVKRPIVRNITAYEELL